MICLKLKEIKEKMKKKHIIYIVLAVLFLVFLALFLYSRFVPNNFIENFYNDVKSEESPDYDVMMSTFVDSFFIYSVSAILIIWIVEVTLRTFKERINDDIENTIRVIIRFVVLIFFLVAYLNKFDSFEGAIIGVAATVGAAFGLAASRSLGDLFSGLYLVLSKHHNVGDYLLIPDMNVEGVVTEISTNFVTLIQPNQSTAVIPTNMLKDEEVHNLKVQHFETEKDGISELLLYGRKVKEIRYTYPLKWATHSDDKHSLGVAAIEKTGIDFQDYLDTTIQWSISQRNRLNRTYVINLTVLDPNDLLTIVGDFTKKLESNYEELKYPPKKTQPKKK